MKYPYLLLLIFLAGCSKSESIKFTEPLRKYIGVWQYMYESETENSFDIKKVLLVISSDSSAIYRQCIMSKTVSENSSSRSSVRNVSLPNPNIVGLSDNEINLEQEAEIFSLGSMYFTYDLAITKGPFLENGLWYMEIDNTLLEKLEGNSVSTQIAWECPKKDD